MNLSRARELFPAATSALWILSGGLGGAVLVTWVARVLSAPVNTDAGYYIPHALLVLGGAVPYRDFPSGYAPGIYYLLALLGDSGLRSPTAFKTVVCAVQLANCGLVYAVLRRLDCNRPLAAVFTALFAGLTSAAWAIAVQLEPFQNVFVLVALWLLLGGREPWRGVGIGLALGVALLVRQYAMFAIAPLLLASVVPMAGESGSAASGAPQWRGPARWQLAWILVSIPLPYMLFLAFTGLDPIDNLLHLATFGGGAGVYGTWGFGPLFQAAAEGRVARYLLPTLAIAAWLLACHRSWRVIVLTIGLVASLVPLYVRTFDYYLQPTLPWTVFVLAEFCRAIGSRFRDTEPARALAAALIVLPLLGIVWSGSRDAFSPVATAADQMQLARDLETEIGSYEDVLIFNGSWLYPLSRFTPPLLDYSFDIDPSDTARRAQTQFAILISGQGPTGLLAAWLQEDGMRVRKKIPWKEMTVYVLDRESGRDREPSEAE